MVGGGWGVGDGGGMVNATGWCHVEVNAEPNLNLNIINGSAQSSPSVFLY